jgi:hypothetical protein
MTQRLITKQQSESRFEPAHAPHTTRLMTDETNHEQIFGVYGSVMPRAMQRLSSRNSPKKLALSHVFEEEESAVI